MRTTLVWWGALLLVLSSCVSAADDADPGDLLPECIEGGAPWSGQPAFRDASTAWNLQNVKAYGTRISVADIDGDGWADVFSRRAGTASDDFAPGGTRVTWLLHNDHGTFSDVTESSGIVKPRTGTGGRPAEIAVFADVDNDGDLDVFTGVDTAQMMPENQSKATAELVLNDGSGRFFIGDGGTELRRVSTPTPRAGAAFTDHDRDGLVDLWVGIGGTGFAEQDRLYRNPGGAGFVEVTDAAGLATLPLENLDDANAARSHHQTWGVNACDLDGDGTPELLSAGYGRSPNHLWLGARDAQGAVTWSNRSVESGYAFDDRMDWTDNDSARCFCQSSPLSPGCAGVPPPQFVQCPGRGWRAGIDDQPFRLGGNSGTTLCADFDNDGALDLLTSEIVHFDVGTNSDPSEILYNDGSARFTRPGNEKTGLVREHAPGWNDGDIINNAFDFDNDGRLDVYIGSEDYPDTRGWLFHQKADGTFEPVPLDVGIDHTSSAGVSWADFDRDGDLDLVIGHSRFRCTNAPGDHCYPVEEAYVRLFENVVGQDWNWIQLHLEGGAGTNRSAVGARVTVKAGDLLQVQEVEGGHGHYGAQNDQVLHFGLGAACEAEVTVRWPDAALTTQTFTVPARQRYHVVQGGEPAAENP